MNSKLVWALVLSFVVIIGLTGLLFWLPPHNAGTENETVTTADDQSTEGAVQTPPKTTGTGTASGAGVRTFEKGVYVTTVYLTTKGFVPQNVTIWHGEEVRFVNKTSLTMRVGSQVQASTSSSFYSSLADPKSEPKGGIYQVGLSQPGVWSFYNLSGDPFTGSVTVK